MCKRNTIGSLLGEDVSPLPGTAEGAAQAASNKLTLAAAPRKNVRREMAEFGVWEIVGMGSPMVIIGGGGTL
jgi:hypothetical protein